MCQKNLVNFCTVLTVHAWDKCTFIYEPQWFIYICFVFCVYYVILNNFIAINSALIEIFRIFGEIIKLNTKNKKRLISYLQENTIILENKEDNEKKRNFESLLSKKLTFIWKCRNYSFYRLDEIDWWCKKVKVPMLILLNICCGKMENQQINMLCTRSRANNHWLYHFYASQWMK